MSTGQQPTQGVSEQHDEMRAPAAPHKHTMVERLSSFFNHGNFQSSLEALVRDFSQSSGVATETHFEPVELAESARQALHRLLQECLANVDMYAQASQVHVDLLNWRDSTVFTVRDDGVGFDMARRNARLCLAGMRREIEACGGELCFFSAPGKGTQVVALLPQVQSDGQPANAAAIN